ncbi:hypothetical protein BJ742DRAFT_341390 [Cladochytrium replicatum]|nr:hypothetical protein BJ742DRAFT_341390 [Cladochytrium replicatum]
MFMVKLSMWTDFFFVDRSFPLYSDISSWINLHPGGSVILNYVTGTDITNDYFNESPGFDASHFVPESKVPMMRSAHNPYTVGRAPSITNTLRSSETDLTSLSSLDGEMLSLEQQLRQSPISEEDWKIITNTRRIHQHSKTAIAKLVEFLVGEIVPEKPVVGVDRVALENGDVRMYDPYEFRRYCMTRKALLTPEGAQFPVYLLRFSLLYPHSDVRVNEPEEQFRPGQCVEIQIKTNKGLWVSRYYSPLSGTTTCFEIAVKVVPNGTMSTFLTSQKPGVKQTKIRGPFGTVLEPGTISKQTRHRDGPRRTRSMQVLGGRSKTISRLIYISAGSGIAPFLQYINDTYLCVGKVMYAFAPYAGEDGSAYLDIQPGDAVFIKFHYGDGWGFGINVRTGQEGEFPASVLVPLSGLTSKTGARAILVNAVRNVSDIFGAQSLLPAVCAFPSMVSATHVVSASGPTISDEDAINKYGGTVFQGKRVDLELLEKLVAEPYDEMRQDGLGSVSVVVCGPPAFEQMVYDQLVDELGILHEDITMLPPSSYWNVESYGQ